MINLVKHQKVLWAGIVSGLVAILTAKFGLSGTVIGSVFSSVLYNFITGYIDEKHDENGNLNIDFQKPRLDLELFYIFPLVVILLIELCYLLTFFISGSSIVFVKLEDITSNNLFRVIGFGLIILGIYPLFDSKTLKKINGSLLVICGLLIFAWGLIDLNNPVSELMGMFLSEFNFIITIFIVLSLVYVIFSILHRKSSNSYYSHPNNTRRFDSSRYVRKSQDNYYDYEHRSPKYNNGRNHSYNRQSRINNYHNSEEHDKYNNINSSSKSLKFFSNKKR